MTTPFRIEQFQEDRPRPDGSRSGVALYGFRLWNDAHPIRPAVVAETFPAPHLVDVSRANMERLARLPVIEAAAAEMVQVLQEVLAVHVYSAEDGEVPPADCRIVASIERVRAALGLAPSGIVTGPADSDTLPSSCPSPVLGDTSPRGSVWGPAAPGIHWLNRDQDAARARGWYLTLVARGCDAVIEVRAYHLNRRYLSDEAAAAHVHAIAETALPSGYSVEDARMTYRDLCQRAAAIVAAAAVREG